MSGSMQFYLAIAIFVLTYVAIMSEKIPRTICAMFGGGAMLYCGYVTQDEAIKQFIDFNTIGLHGSPPDCADDDFSLSYASHYSRTYPCF